MALYADGTAAKGAAGKHATDATAAATALQGGGFTQALQVRRVGACICCAHMFSRAAALRTNSSSWGTVSGGWVGGCCGQHGGTCWFGHV